MKLSELTERQQEHLRRRTTSLWPRIHANTTLLDLGEEAHVNALQERACPCPAEDWALGCVANADGLLNCKRISMMVFLA